MNQPKAYKGTEPYIFVSYAHADSDRVLPIIAALQERGYRVWYDAGIEAGTEWPEYIAQHLYDSGAVIAFVSVHSAHSHNCSREINFSIKLRKDPLVVYLEDVELSLGMQMQLESLQAMFRSRHGSLESFMNELCESQILEQCREGLAERTFDPGISEEAEEYYQIAKAAYEQKSYAMAVKWSRRAAELGHAGAQVILGRCCRYGDGTEQNYSEGLAWFRKAEKQGSVEAQVYIGLCYSMGHGVEKDKQAAAIWFRKAAERGNAEGQFFLGQYYYYADPPEQDYVEAAKWFKRAAEQGEVAALAELGRCFVKGHGVEQSVEKGLNMIREAAAQEQSDGLAHYVLREVQMEAEEWYKEGENSNGSESVSWYLKAAQYGHAAAQVRVGHAYYKGAGVPQSYEEAAKWYRKAAEQGDVYGQCNLGKCFWFGTGVPEDDAEARKWLELAAAQNVAGANYYLEKMALSPNDWYNLGLDYMVNHDMKDRATAILWYRKAARHGSEKAKQRLKEMGESL